MRREVVVPGIWGTSAGYGVRSGRRFVAAYVTPARDAVILQVGRRRFELDGVTRIRHRKSFPFGRRRAPGWVTS